MFAVGMCASPGSPNAGPRYVAALRAERRGALALDSLLQYSNAEALERFAEYCEASTRWHDDVESMTASPNAAVLDTARIDETPRSWPRATWSNCWKHLSVEPNDAATNGQPRLGGARVTLWLAITPEP